MSDDQPITTPKPFCFVLMPFKKQFNDAYDLAIKKACEEAGAYSERVDKQIFQERILDRIYNQIAKADIIIADMSGQNPNVFYEVGYAHALGKLTILATKKADDIPFDLKHFPHVVYGSSLTKLHDELKTRVRHFVLNPPKQPADVKVEIDVYLEGRPMGAGNTMYTVTGNGHVWPMFMVHNRTGQVLRLDDFRLGIIASREWFPIEDNSGVTVTMLPNNQWLLMLPAFPPMLPDAQASFGFSMSPSPNSHLPEEKFVARLYTKTGPQDFPFTIRQG